MKRNIAFLITLVMCFTLLCACTKKDDMEITPPDSDVQDKTEDTGSKEEKTEKIYVDYGEKHKEKLFDIKDKIKVNGRCNIDEEKGILSAWSNSGIEFAGWFEGGIKLFFTTSSYLPIPFYVVIDGDYENAKPVELSAQKTFVTLANVERGYHTVSLCKVDGAIVNDIYLTAIEYKGLLDEEPLPKSIKIEVVGASTASGVGLVSKNYNDDAFYSYGAITARNLNADLSVVAASGWGIACGINDFKKVIPGIYDLTCYFTDEEEKWDFANNQVDAVIINLGTNDYTQYANGDRTDLHNALRKFFDTLRECYPEARIYMSYGMMSNVFVDDFKAIIAERNDEKIEFVDLFRNSDGVGGHPSAEAHVKYAEIYEEKLREDFNITDNPEDIKQLIKEKNKLVTTIAPKS